MNHRRLGPVRRRPAASSGRGGNVSLEFAILSIPFFMLSLGTMEVGYDFFVQAALSNAVHVAARSMQVGTTQGAVTGAAEASWAASQVCPALGGMLDCGQLYVSVTSIPSGVGQNYYSYMLANPPSLTAMTAATNAVNTCSAGKMMLLQAYYLSPSFIGLLVPLWSQAAPTGGGGRVHVTYAATGYVNEYFTGGEPGC